MSDKTIASSLLRQEGPQQDLDLAPIKARVERATSAPWFFRVGKVVSDGSVMIGAVAPGHQIRAMPSGGTYPANDGEFMAHARQDIPALIAEIERLRAKPEHAPPDLLARLRDYHDQVLQGFRHISRVEEADLIQAAIDGLRQLVWLPIESALKDDGQDMIVADGDGLVGHGFFDRANSIWRWLDDDPIRNPTHWMPMPKPPAVPPVPPAEGEKKIEY